ncbi:MAG TPA: thioredoxin family protein [Caldimonas sp.]|nr:thioredoxin family protein [Caldimonas sp.]HEX2540729.1 thioredoxin family protein [Caldimonas sp.]
MKTAFARRPVRSAAVGRGRGSTPAALLALIVGAALAGCGRGDEAAPGAPSESAAAAPADAKPAKDGGIAWRAAASDAQIDAAFAVARAENKPVFVYWGAKWCPPCNQVQATLFNRQDFIERTRAFVPVYVDGDVPGAQKVGARFRVSGYPTLVLFSPHGQELTRLPGEADPARYTQLLTLGMNAARPVKTVLAHALAGGAGMSANDWRLLAFYSWETDEQQVVPKDRVPATLARLADTCPDDPPDTAMRLRLKALAAADEKNPARADPVVRAATLALLADPPRARQQTDTLTSAAAEIVRALSKPGTPERATLVAAFEQALKRLQGDATLSRADRMQAVIAQVDLARIDSRAEASGPSAAKAAAPPLPPALVAEVREQAARADREIADGYERMAVIPAAAYLLERAGLGDESDALLKANLARSHSPYYLMSGLASNAKKRGDTVGALRWYRDAFEKSEGPSTRLQWGASYLNALIEMTPGDEGAIEAMGHRLLDEAASQPDAFYERSARSLQRIGTRLQAWNQGGVHGAVLSRLQKKLDAICAAPGRSDAERATCTGLLAPAAKPSA